MEVFLVLLRCVRVVLIARRGAAGVYPVQPTMQNIVTKIRGSKRLKKCSEFLTAKRFVRKDFLNFYGNFWAIFG
jgi:hypothetical protein